MKFRRNYKKFLFDSDDSRVGNVVIFDSRKESREELNSLL